MLLTNTSTYSGGHQTEQWVYNGSYVYFSDGICESIQQTQ